VRGIFKTASREQRLMFEASPTGLVRNPNVWRLLWRGLRLRPADFALGGDRDPELLGDLAHPFASVEDVSNRLETLEAALVERSDRRAVFLTVYTEMTAQTAREIDAGSFDDPEWMCRYLVRFAEHYRRAFVGFERGEYADVPDPWLVAFGSAVGGDALVIQDAFLGINAHIVYDLALALSAIGLDPGRETKYADHRRIDAILARLVAVQRELLAERYAPGLEAVGEGMGGLDERWSTSTLRRAREFAWRTAVVRTDARWSTVRSSTGWLLSRTATGGASVLLSPTASPSTMRALRAIEATEFELESYARAFHGRAVDGGASIER
jgi:hypothetical protein